MSKEIYHEGWLIKSPPKKSIWLPKQWRRRWFTLKQGEIPEQFCLEYYEDRSCRILKGVIDLDQCEQVDAGLRLEHKKQKFQHMFDVKTPRRTYYLAAESEADMIDWVNSICQVCNLQDLTKQQTTSTDSRQYYNVGADAITNQPHATTMSLNRRELALAGPSGSMDMKPSPDLIQSARLSLHRAQENSALYQNFEAPLRQPGYTMRETMVCETSLAMPSHAPPPILSQKEEYYNFPAIAEANLMRTFERSHSLRTAGGSGDTDTIGTNVMPSHGRTQSLVDQKSNLPAFGRKIPESLKLIERGTRRESELSPALSTSSGPYIAISECISGHPLSDKEPPPTPLNSLDPKFYETPRNHINIGLNLTATEQPYSPKRNNGPVQTQQRQTRSGRSTPTDSESVFASDDEDWVAPTPTEGTIDRRLRPSDSSVENDSIDYTHAQRFSKMPTADDERVTDKTRSKRPAAALVLTNTIDGETNKETNSSDTENASPAIPIGPKDVNSCVEENYDIPRSHQMPYYNLNNSQDNEDHDGISPTLSTLSDAITVSTPNLAGRFSSMSMVSATSSKFSTMQNASRTHSYTNAAPSNVDGNVFRYDFHEQDGTPAPAVDRKLKPKIPEKKPKESTRPLSILSTTSINSIQSDMRPSFVPPCINRKLKPATPQKSFETNSLRRAGGSNMYSLMGTDFEFQTDHDVDVFSKTLPRNYPTNALSLVAPPIAKPSGNLEYFDLDRSNPPSICKNSHSSSVSTSNLASLHTVGLPNVNHLLLRAQPHRPSGLGMSSTMIASALTPPQSDIGMNTASDVVYKQVDFVKTEAIKLTRENAEKSREKAEKSRENQSKD